MEFPPQGYLNFLPSLSLRRKPILLRDQILPHPPLREPLRLAAPPRFFWVRI
jgi:hypothetical protein